VSFASLPYFGVNSFKFTNAKGDSTFVRYPMKPEGDAQYLTKEQFAAAGPNYLVDEIRKRVGDGPVRMKLQVQVAEPGDKIEDPSIAWPDSRKTVELGVVEIDKVDSDSDAAQRARYCSSRTQCQPASSPPTLVGAVLILARQCSELGDQCRLGPRFRCAAQLSPRWSVRVHGDRCGRAAVS